MAYRRVANNSAADPLITAHCIETIQGIIYCFIYAQVPKFRSQVTEIFGIAVPAERLGRVPLFTRDMINRPYISTNFR